MRWAVRELPNASDAVHGLLLRQHALQSCPPATARQGRAAAAATQRFPAPPVHVCIDSLAHMCTCVCCAWVLQELAGMFERLVAALADGDLRGMADTALRFAYYWCAVLCCAVLCCAVLCCAVLVLLETGAALRFAYY